MCSLRVDHWGEGGYLYVIKERVKRVDDLGFAWVRVYGWLDAWTVTMVQSFTTTGWNVHWGVP